jgi:hypothetical protein
MRRLFGWMSVVLMASGILSWMAFLMIGSEVDAAGYLREPFALIPIGWLCLLGTLVTGTIYSLMRLREKHHPAT